MVVLRLREWLVVSPDECFWVYDMCEEMPKWDIVKQDYIFEKKPKRITAQNAKEIIKLQMTKHKSNKIFYKGYF